MNTKLPSITISGWVLSDLFFNSELSNYSQVRFIDVPKEEFDKQSKEALLQDAKDFAEIIGNSIKPEDLVEDFLARM